MFRQGRPGTSVDFEGRVAQTADDPAALARRMDAELKEQREVVEPLDEGDRTLAGADLEHDDNSDLRRIRRYETAIHRRYCFNISEIRQDCRQTRDIAGLKPKWLDGNVPAPPVA